MKDLMTELAEYAKSDIYPFHMPGHKRRMRLPEDAYHLDITEIDGFDNLHHATGILAEEQARMAKLIGSERTYFLVNGSTCGILTAISATVSRGGKLLMSRNSHKAAYHAVELRQLETEYLFPEITDDDIQGAVSVEKMKASLEQDKEEQKKIEAVYITSPTYDGVVSDVRAIAELVHAYDKILIVDEAHGAHFGFHPAFPQSAISLGADLVIQSVHKTLSAFTQSALLHLCSDRIDPGMLSHYLGIYESSSPSYVLMAGISSLASFLEEDGAQRFEALAEQLQQFYQKAEQLHALHVLQAENFPKTVAFDRDISKILISTKNCVFHGKDLYNLLLERYHLQLEMCSGEYVTALCSFMDEQEGFERLWQALKEIDASQENAQKGQKNTNFVRKMYRSRDQVSSIASAVESKKNTVFLQDAAGLVSGEYVYLYPPGIPILVPGERIDSDVICHMSHAKEMGLELEGLSDLSGERIQIISG